MVAEGEREGDSTLTCLWGYDARGTCPFGQSGQGKEVLGFVLAFWALSFHSGLTFEVVK